MKVTSGRVGGVLVLALMRACRLLPEPEIRTLTLAGEDMAGGGRVNGDGVHNSRVTQAHTSPVSGLTFWRGL